MGAVRSCCKTRKGDSPLVFCNRTVYNHSNEEYVLFLYVLPVLKMHMKLFMSVTSYPISLRGVSRSKYSVHVTPRDQYTVCKNIYIYISFCNS